ncbi:MAG: hypothetical protein ACMUEM_03370 [Flavobacteriales bacterium AspAUS03]
MFLIYFVITPQLSPGVQLNQNDIIYINGIPNVDLLLNERLLKLKGAKMLNYLNALNYRNI